jgi:prepilin-type N-terminal cleavage/methylation domain-containing protein
MRQMRGAARRARRFPARRAASDGFTLLEVLLVLALIVVLSALTLPALEGPLATRRLQAAGDQLSTAWIRARLWAMDSGQVQVFTCDLEQGTYRVTPYDGLNGQATNVVGDGVIAELPRDVAAVVPHAPRAVGHLPENVVFAAGQAAAAGPGVLPAAGPTATTPGSGAPIVFYPDGTSSTAEVWLVNDRGQTVPVRLRGLTGTAVVGEVEAAEERP